MSIILDDLQGRGNIRKVAGTNGGEYHGPCPLCGGDDRFHVWPEQGEAGTWWCRGCGKGGDAIAYLMDYCGQDFKTAAAAVGRDLTDAPRTPVTPRPRQKPVFMPAKPAAPADLWREKAGKLVEWAHAQLLDNPDQLAYLAGRGISEACVRRYQLGYNPGENGKNAIFRARTAWGLPDEQKNGRARPLWIPSGLVIPMIAGGEVQRIRIRREKADLTPEFNAPYYVLPGSSRATLTIGDDRRAVVVVEAELDAFACADAAGDTCTAMAMGSSSTKPDAAATDVLSGAVCILNALDFDTAGAKAWAWWRDQFTTARRWPVPSGKDPGDAFADGTNLRAWILAGLPPVFRRRTGSTVLDGEDHGKAVTGKEEAPTGETDETPVDLPENIRQVADWFKACPVRVIKDGKRLRYIEDRSWASAHPDLSRRINLALFMDPDVFGFVAAHPARVVNGQNFMNR